MEAPHSNIFIAGSGGGGFIPREKASITD